MELTPILAATTRSRRTFSLPVSPDTYCGDLLVPPQLIQSIEEFPKFSSTVGLKGPGTGYPKDEKSRKESVTILQNVIKRVGGVSAKALRYHLVSLLVSQSYELYFGHSCRCSKWYATPAMRILVSARSIGAARYPNLYYTYRTLLTGSSL